MRLDHLLQDVPAASVTGPTDVEITDITSDSRAVRPGTLFVALVGQVHDGHAYLAEAAAKGAAAVVCQALPDLPLEVPTVLVAETHLALGQLASAFHGHPSRRLKLVGITGTDGKTTTTTLTAAALRLHGFRTAHLTTVEAHDGLEVVPNTAGFTTPQAMDVQRFLAAAVAKGASHAVLEVSSHALSTGRVAGCEFDVAVFTNLAPEHLDYHHTLEEYRAAKGILFAMLNGPRTKGSLPTGIVNADDPAAGYFAGIAPRTVTYGLNEGAQVRASGIRSSAAGTNFFLHVPESHSPSGDVMVATRLLGEFNVYNWLAAAGAALAAGAGPRAVIEAAARTSAPPGRLERLAGLAPFEVFVDFAHTPHGLQAALQTLRDITAGRVIAVFGHAGRRDLNHRRGLVSAAKGRCDLMILTMDDPYDEDPSEILRQMRDAAIDLGLHEGSDFTCILDRREAFAAAFAAAAPGDTVLLAGRGHETTIPLDGQKLPFHDPTVARELLTGG